MSHSMRPPPSSSSLDLVMPPPVCYHVCPLRPRCLSVVAFTTRSPRAATTPRAHDPYHWDLAGRSEEMAVDPHGQSFHYPLEPLPQLLPIQDPFFKHAWLRTGSGRREAAVCVLAEKVRGRAPMSSPAPRSLSVFFTPTTLPTASSRPTPTYRSFGRSCVCCQLATK